MKSGKSHSESHRHSPEKIRFSGSVEIIPPHPVFIEFITAKQLWGFPLKELAYFVLGDNPERGQKNPLPPDLLVLVFKTRIVCLFGWRLEFMLDPLMQGRVKRVHAEKHLGTLMIGEPWVSEVRIITQIIPF